MMDTFERNQFLTPVFQAIEKLTGAILWINSAGNLVHASKEANHWLGFSASQLVGTALFDLEPGLDAAMFESRWNTLSSSNTSRWDSEFVHAGGKRLPVSMQALLVEVAGDMLACIHLQPANPDSSKTDFLRDCLLANKIATWEWNIATDKIEASEFCYETFGLEKGQPISRLNLVHILRPFLTGKQMEELNNGIMELTKSPFQFEHSVTLHYRSGSEKKLLLSFRPWFHNGEPVAVRGYLKEMAETPGSRAESFARKMMDFSNDLVFWLDADMFVHYANKAALKTLNYAEEEITRGIQWNEIAPEMPLHRWERFFKENEGKERFSFQVELKSKFGRPLSLRCFCAQVNIEPKKLYYLAIQQGNDSKQAARTDHHVRLMETMRLARKLEKERDYLKEELNSTYDHIVTLNHNYKEMLRKVEELARASCHVLIQGEAGTGKKLLARAVHKLSSRSTQPLIKVNCKQIPPQSLEKELFGYKQSNQGGLSDESLGWIDVAEGGTLLLDEIGGLSPLLQTKLLRVMQEGKYERVGSSKLHTADVRVVATTGRDLKHLVDGGSFSYQLLSQFKQGTVYSIPLRERKSDIPALVQYFTLKQTGMPLKGASEMEAKNMAKLAEHDYPGNIRELQEMVANTPSHGQAALSPANPAPNYISEQWEGTDTGQILSLEEMQRQHILHVLKLTNGKVSGKNGAAELLNLNAQTLFSKMRKLGIRLS
jgi:transcriptional regulator with PAS, ATPase and Fis domain